MKTKRRKVEIVIKLPRALELPGHLVGAMAKTKICGIGTSVFTPSFRKRKSGDQFQPFVGVKTTVDWEKYFSKPPYDKKMPWGSVNGWKSGKGARGITSFSLRRMIAITDDAITPYMAQKLYHSLDEWGKLLCDWYDVYFQENGRNRLEVEQHSKDHECVLINDLNKIDKRLRCKHATTISITKGDDIKVRKKDWIRLLELCATQTLPPEAHILLRDSRNELGKRNYRRSVLDAATAAEMALIQLRDSTLSSTDSNISVLIKKKYKGLSELVTYLSKMGQTIPQNIIEDIAVPRNKAIHQGVMPSKDEAAACLKKSTELVNQVLPVK